MKKLTMEDLFVNKMTDKEQFPEEIEKELEEAGVVVKDCYFAEVINLFGSMGKMKMALDTINVPYEGRTFKEVIDEIADKLNGMTEPQRLVTIAIMAGILTDDKLCKGTVGFSDVVA